MFQGRYKGILVEQDSYLLELQRYVVLNPVRAHMVKRVEDWTWISYHAMIGNQPAPTWLNSEWALSQFGATRARQRERYAEFMRQGIEGAGVWQDLKGQGGLEYEVQHLPGGNVLHFIFEATVDKRSASTSPPGKSPHNAREIIPM